MAAIKLVGDELNNIDKYKDFILNNVKSQSDLLEVIKNLIHKYNCKNINDYLLFLAPYIEQYKITKSLIFKLSHIFCTFCVFYKPAPLCTWKKENPELFETEIYFFYNFFILFPKIKKDVPSYSLEEIYRLKKPIVSEQSTKEKLKILNSLTKYYKHF